MGWVRRPWVVEWFCEELLDPKGGVMKSERTIMEILEAFDLVGTYSGAARLAGCAPNTVKRYVLARERGENVPVGRKRRVGIVDAYRPKIEELVEQSQGQIEARVVFSRLVSMGYEGSRRVVERVVRACKDDYVAAHRRVHRPLVPSPGQWLQYDFGDGPVVAGQKTILFVAYLPWSKMRFVAPMLDKTLPSVVTVLDRAFRYFGGTPDMVLTDNEKTVTVDNVCSLPVRHHKIVSMARFYGTTIHTCEPYDPATKGGVEASVKVAKADLVPRETNLLGEYECFADLDAACEEFTTSVNTRRHARGWVPLDRLEEERARFHPLPAEPYPLAVGQERRVSAKTPMVRFQGVDYSVPWQHMTDVVYCRLDATQERVVISHRRGDGMIVTLASHPQGKSGDIVLRDEHFPVLHPTGPLDRKPKARSSMEKRFLSIGAGAQTYVQEAAAQGVSHLRQKIERIVEMLGAWDAEELDGALALAAKTSRWRIQDLESLCQTGAQILAPVYSADETGSLSQGTSAWEDTFTANKKNAA